MPHSAKSSDSTLRLGILGGGQLGWFLCEAARRLGIETCVIDPARHAPARAAADSFIQAPLNDAGALARLIANCDVITFEQEAIPEPTLELLKWAELRGQVRVEPRLDTLRTLSDKGTQKTWLASRGLPTLPFSLVGADIKAQHILNGPLCLPLVQKTRRGGYDGRGVQLLASEADLNRIWPTPSVVEKALENPVEVAVITVRSATGEILNYPAVSMSFDGRFNAVARVDSPALIDRELRHRCENIALRAVEELRGAGVFAVELFVDSDAEIYINEISPRVHNAGHLTMEAFRHCQFEQHVRAVTGLPLMPIFPRARSATLYNLLHDPRSGARRASSPCGHHWLDDSRDTRLYWYGKAADRAGRKLGHVTAIAESTATAWERARAGLRALHHRQLPRLPTALAS